MQTITCRVSRLTISDIAMIGLWSFMCLLGLSRLAWDSWRAGGLAQAWTQNMSISMSATLVLIGFACALVVWERSMKIGGTGYLKLDARGLTHAEGRVRRQWRWDELSTFKLERYWGRRHVVFTVPGEAGRVTHYEASKRNLPEGPPVRIQDIYDTPLEDIAATLNEYRERVLANGPPTDGPQAPEQA